MTPSYSIERLTEILDSDFSAFVRIVGQLSTSTTLDIDQLKKVVANPHTMMFGARDENGGLIGTLSLATFDIPTGTRAWIEDVVVDDAVRGQGVGEALVHAAFDAAKAVGARTIDLTSRPSREAANRLYERLGFTRRETNVWRYEGN